MFAFVAAGFLQRQVNAAKDTEKFLTAGGFRG